MTENVKSINFMSVGNYFFPLSMIIIIISVSLLLFSKVNLGIDFTSGTRFDLTILSDKNKILKISDLTNAIDTLGLKNEFIIKELKSEKTVDYQMFSIISQNNFDEQLILNAFKSNLKISGDSLKPIQTVTISPKMGKELIRSASISLGLAVLLILIYITIRFNSFFAVSSILALIHDVSITVGIFILFGLEVNLPIIAAFLTILGYSLNDTIVVFDRIRENLNKSKKKDNITDITNLSINQTLTRTILTSLTTLIVLLILYLIGNYLIKLFTFALIIGVAIGTYSSIFVAGFCFNMLYNKYGYILNSEEADEEKL